MRRSGSASGRSRPSSTGAGAAGELAPTGGGTGERADATQRSDAWRCSAGNELLDPCFSSPLAPGVVVCPAAPWLHTAVTIRLTKPLPTAEGDHGVTSLARQPWTLELYDGSRCLLATGATTVLDGRRLNHFCARQSKTGLWGDPSRTTEPWRIYRAPFTAKRLTQRVAIRRAWS